MSQTWRGGPEQGRQRELEEQERKRKGRVVSAATRAEEVAAETEGFPQAGVSVDTYISRE